ncbi:MAG TPA: hypothetical protein VND93_20635, partial [Myxococcales bacterium]|nr:hypothetical protein [Myxococcales bacterium]
DQLLQAAPRPLEQLLRDCEGFPGFGDPAAARAFLLQHRKRYSARHVAFPYRWQTPEGIRQAVRARATLERLLDEMSGKSLAPALVRDLVRARVPLEGPAGLPARRLGRARSLAALATLSPTNAVLTWKAHRQASAYQRRIHEAPALPGAPWDEVPRFARLRIAPDAQVQNPLTHLAPLAIGRWGAAMLKLQLRLVNIRLRRYLVGLNRIQGIHHARWVVFRTAGRYYLLFLSCFDGTWDGYIGSFFDDLPVRALLESLWKSSQRFQEARTLDGFKSWILARQVPTSVFHSAHREQRLGVADVHQALQVRAMIDGARPQEELAAYLRAGTCGPELPQLSIKGALGEIARALFGWLGRLKRRLAHGHVHGRPRRHPAPRPPRVPEAGRLPGPADRAWAGPGREVVAPG